MSRKSPNAQEGESPHELLRDLLILELAKEGVPQLEIRKIVKCDVHRVNRIAAPLQKARRQSLKKAQKQVLE